MIKKIVFVKTILLSLLLLGGGCGIKPAGSRIVGGTQAQKDSWPWQAMLASAGGSQFCGGSLVDEQWVLTASHCVDGVSASQIVVRFVVLLFRQKRVARNVLQHFIDIYTLPTLKLDAIKQAHV